MKQNFTQNLTPLEAVRLQQEIRHKVKVVPLEKEIKTVAGADVSMNLYESDAYAGIVVFSYPELELLEESFTKEQTNFPYIPGLLSFREIPSLLTCYKNLKRKPDLIIVDGQGIAHPRRLGIASHFGVLTETPTIGCAKSVLYGVYDSVESGLSETGSFQEIKDPSTGEVIGVAMHSKKRSNPLIVSPGHLVSLEQAIEVVRLCLRGYRLPEPTRQAHEAVNRFRRQSQATHY
ncbi:MAG: deoxyribonuclease V [Patescibacteria group bacterium]